MPQLPELVVIKRKVARSWLVYKFLVLRFARRKPSFRLREEPNLRLGVSSKSLS